MWGGGEVGCHHMCLLNRERMLRLEKENQIMRKRLESPSGESGQEVSTPHNLH